MEEVTAIFDIGKTNKKLFLFDSACNVVHEYSESLPETSDDDGFSCEDIHLLKKWVAEQWDGVISKKEFKISSLNFTSYGASLVHLNKNDDEVTPIYSYLKPYPAELADEFYERYGGKWDFSAVTSSPPIGMLNSGLQLLWIKHRKPQLFEKITTSLHLPQYLSFIFSKIRVSEYTSIGCHTALWDFSQNQYHQWVGDEGIDKLLAPVMPDFAVGKLKVNDKEIAIGCGLHDSSSALIPYLKKIRDPFLLISTGTWCITLNPFNTTPLTSKELSQDCLCYMTANAKPIKASRIFLGKEHEFQTERIEKHFGKNNGYCKDVQFKVEEIRVLLNESNNNKRLIPSCMEATGPFPTKSVKEWDIEQFSSCENAYLQLLLDMTCMLRYSVMLVSSDNEETIFVEGGFGDNEIFMHLLANHFPGKKVKTSFLKQATALGAVLQINESYKLDDWKFRNYEASDISTQLESYYDRFWKMN